MAWSVLGIEQSRGVKPEPMSSAPIALFVFRRPEHTRRTLESLARNAEFERSALHVFCDGSRGPADDAAVNATRRLVREWPHPHKTVHEAPVNQGLAASIIDGVTALCDAHGSVIVVEDDLVVAPVFLEFLNRALDVYADDFRVMQVSGHMFPVELPRDEVDTVLLPLTTSWGWATWKRSWDHFDPAMNGFGQLKADSALRRDFDFGNSAPYFDMLVRQKRGLIDSWAIRWYLSVFLEKGLVIYPKRSLVRNEGFDGSGTHSKGGAEYIDLLSDAIAVPKVLSMGTVDQPAKAAISYYFRRERGWPKRVLDWYRRINVNRYGL